MRFRKQMRKLIPPPEPEKGLTPYDNLALAIVKQACLDYRLCLRYRSRQGDGNYQQCNRQNGRNYQQCNRQKDGNYPRCRRCMESPDCNIEELEQFFRSGWFQLLTDTDGIYLLERLRKE